MRRWIHNIKFRKNTITEPGWFKLLILQLGEHMYHFCTNLSRSWHRAFAKKRDERQNCNNLQELKKKTGNRKTLNIIRKTTFGYVSLWNRWICKILLRGICCVENTQNMKKKKNFDLHHISQEGAIQFSFRLRKVLISSPGPQTGYPYWSLSWLASSTHRDGN